MATRRAAAIPFCILILVVLKPFTFAESVEGVQDQKAELSCEELGFTGLGLRRFCDTFAEYVKDAGETASLFDMRSRKRIKLFCRLGSWPLVYPAYTGLPGVL